ncbi:hypothetical protein N7466_003894 [Penicillium verhagenii]|uniref:uncharacterized protein n=1 Tax=Penicillium verhagenii TaxID=1562060 RepID=UPI002545A250|nr:uncharacterized protein N7466_003894 [Penicillium verhagenii]KAJ5934347.1 hypothetical protein N7466_003894 [Penicillium verhagenii]
MVQLTRRLTGHLHTKFNKESDNVAGSRNTKPNLSKKEALETPRKTREYSTDIDADPKSSDEDDVISIGSDTSPQRPRKEKRSFQRLDEKLSNNTNNVPLTAKRSFAEDVDDNEYVFNSSQRNTKRKKQTTFGRTKSFSSTAPLSSARSVEAQGNDSPKPKASAPTQPLAKKGKSKKGESKKGASKKGKAILKVHSSDSEPEVVAIKDATPVETPAPSPSPEVRRSPSPRFKLPPTIPLDDIFYTSSFGASNPNQLDAGFSSDSALSPATSISCPSPSRSPSPPRKALCPMCKAEVDPELLRQFREQPNQRLRDQERFCTSHSQESATKEWEARGYPDIEWDTFEQRLDGHFPDLERFLNPEEPSYYRNILDSAHKAGKSLRLTLDGDGIETISCGYYGSKGAQKMLYVVMDRFAVRLRRLAKNDSLVAKVGIAGYAQSVIVPELATRLIKQDMGVAASIAREIMRDSIEIGEKLNPQANDHVPFDPAEEEVY